jgi:predicted transcriptional regulator
MITTVNLPDDLHSKLKELADREHRSVNATLIVAAERYIEEQDHRTRVRDAARRVVELNGDLLDRLAQ